MISMIACVDNNFGIGKDNELLTKIPEDMNHFKRETVGSICVFGRKTAESLPNKSPLPERQNIILTTELGYRLDGFDIVHDPQDILELGKIKDVYICGGAEIYELFMPYADNILLTSLSKTYDADTFFPHASMGLWLMGAMNENLAITETEYEYGIESRAKGSYEDIDYTILNYIRYTKGDSDLNDQ